MNTKKIFISLLLGLAVLCTPFFAQDTDQTVTTETVETQTEKTAETAPEVVTEAKTEAPETDFPITTPDKITDLISSLEWYDFLFILAFNLLGYLSAFIPVLRKIGDTEIRVGIGAVVLIMILASVDISQAWKLAIEFVISTKLYDWVLSLIQKTPKAENPTVLVST